MWRELLEQTSREIAILVYAAPFLPEQQLDLVEPFQSVAAGGCRVRLALGNPKSPKLFERGPEERFGTGIGSPAELALLHYDALNDVQGVEIRTHETTLYNSLCRFDDVLLVNADVWGVSAFAAPVLHLVVADCSTHMLRPSRLCGPYRPLRIRVAPPPVNDAITRGVFR